MLERMTWGSGQIARPGFPSTHPAGEFFWVLELLGAIKTLLYRLETRAKHLLDPVWVYLFGVTTAEQSLRSNRQSAVLTSHSKIGSRLAESDPSRARLDPIAISLPTTLPTL